MQRPDLGDTIFVRSTHHYGDSPDWIPSIVTNTSYGPGELERDKDLDEFVVTMFYPAIVVSKPFDRYNVIDYDKTWRLQPGG